MPMRKILIPAAVVVLVGAVVAMLLLDRNSDAPKYQTARAERHDLRMVINTNGIIEPVDRSEIYAPVDGVVARIPVTEGARIARGQTLVELESTETRTALSNARTALLEARRQAERVETGPPQEEITVLEASIAEAALALERTRKDLAVEEGLLEKGAVARASVEALARERDRLRLRIEGLERQRRDLAERYSAQEKEWEREKVRELARQVTFLERQIGMETVRAPREGVLFALEVQPGAHVARGQLLARINQPGRVRLRAYVDEPDLGRIAEGQPARIEWDGLAGRHWNGAVEKPAEQVVDLDNRTVGYVLCSIEGEPKELIPNLNVKVEITTEQKPGALTVPRSAVFSLDGKRAVLVLEGPKAVVRTVLPGLVTAEEIEILEGVREGEVVATNPLDMNSGRPAS
jgi:HlyD family secretion protein